MVWIKIREGARTFLVCWRDENGRERSVTFKWNADTLSADPVTADFQITRAQARARAEAFRTEKTQVERRSTKAHKRLPDLGWYWEALNEFYSAAAELRFNGSYVMRYGDEPGPDTDFARRFGGREELVSMYAMAARQTDLLTEYLCLYRILEGADAERQDSRS